MRDHQGSQGLPFEEDVQLPNVFSSSVSQLWLSWDSGRGLSRKAQSPGAPVGSPCSCSERHGQSTEGVQVFSLAAPNTYPDAAWHASEAPCSRAPETLPKGDMLLLPPLQKFRLHPGCLIQAARQTSLLPMGIVQDVGA